jgi:anti-anti-sigma factor
MPPRTPKHPSNVTFDGDRAVIRVSGVHFDDAADPKPGEQLYRLIDDLGRSEVALDFENVRFVSSIGLTILVSINKRLRAAGGRLIILNVQPPVCEIFSVTHLETLLEIHPKITEAPV